MSDFESGHLSYISAPEPKIIARDWRDNEIYEGEAIYEITEPNGKVVLIHEDELKEYIEWQIGPAKVL